MSCEDFRKSFTQDRQGIDATLSEAKRGRDEVTRVESVLQSTPKILDDLDAEFCKRTKLEPLDVSVMFVAIGLQVARQYLLTKFPARLDDQTAAKSTRGHIEEHSNRQSVFPWWASGLAETCLKLRQVSTKLYNPRKPLQFLIFYDTILILRKRATKNKR